MADWRFDPTTYWRNRNVTEPQVKEALGFIPSFLESWKPGDKLVDILHKAYSHGGGWHKMLGWRIDPTGIAQYGSTDPEDCEDGELPDPPLHPLTCKTYGDEIIFVYLHGWVAVVSLKDMTFEMSRMD